MSAFDTGASSFCCGKNGPLCFNKSLLVVVGVFARTIPKKKSDINRAPDVQAAETFLGSVINGIGSLWKKLLWNASRRSSFTYCFTVHAMPFLSTCFRHPWCMTMERRFCYIIECKSDEVVLQNGCGYCCLYTVEERV